MTMVRSRLVDMKFLPVGALVLAARGVPESIHSSKDSSGVLNQGFYLLRGEKCYEGSDYFSADVEMSASAW